MCWVTSVMSDSLQPLWTVACQVPLSMEFSRQKYWSGLPFPTPGDLLDSGIKPGSPAKEADSLPSEPPVESWFFLRSLNSGFHSCSPSYIATTVHKDSLFSTSSPTLLCLVFLMVAVLIGWRWYLNAVLICISQMISDVQHLFIYLWAIACQAPLSMGFSRQKYWSGLPCLLPGNLPNPRIEPTSLISPALAGRFFTTSATWEASFCCTTMQISLIVSTFPSLGILPPLPGSHTSRSSQRARLGSLCCFCC